MRRIPILRPVPWDGAVVLAVIALAVFVAARPLIRDGGGPLTAVVFINGAEADRVELDRLSGPERRRYAGNGYTLEAEFSPDGIRVESADCPTLDCVRTGRIARAGQSIVCLPARIIFRLEGGGSPGPDTPDAVLG